MNKSLVNMLIDWASEKGPIVTQEQIVRGIDEFTYFQDAIKHKRLLTSLLKRVDIYKEVEHTYRLVQSKVNIEKVESTGGLTVYHLDLLTGLEFEEFLGWFFSQRGAKTNVTKSRSDHGVNIIVEMEQRKIAVQARRYKPSSGVGAVAVRDTFAGMKNYGCQEALAITTTFYTKQAKDEAEKLGVELWDRSRFQSELNLLNRTENLNRPKMLKPESKIDRRELREVDLSISEILKNNQILGVKVEQDVVSLCNSKGGSVGIVKGFDAKWIQKYSSKGAVFKIKARNIKNNGTWIDAEAQWFDVK